MASIDRIEPDSVDQPYDGRLRAWIVTGHRQRVRIARVRDGDLVTGRYGSVRQCAANMPVPMPISFKSCGGKACRVDTQDGGYGRCTNAVLAHSLDTGLPVDRLSSTTAFVKMVDLGSFAGAAAALGISPQMVAKHVSYLEACVGTRLLNRTTRKQSLTEIGRTYYYRCRQALAEVEWAEALPDEAKGTPRGRRRINAPVSFGAHGLVPVVSHYLESPRKSRSTWFGAIIALKLQNPCPPGRYDAPQRQRIEKDDHVQRRKDPDG